MLLTADSAVGGSQTAGSGLNDAGFDYRKISTNQHRVIVPKNRKIFFGETNNSDCVGVSGDKYFDEFAQKAFSVKTQIILDDGVVLGGVHRFKSILKLCGHSLNCGKC